jgi:hypothetical protein
MKLRSKKPKAPELPNGLTGFVALPGILRPEFADALRFPNDITRLAAQNVSELLGKYTALQAFALHEQALVNIKELDLDQQEALLKATIIGERPNVQHLERWRRDDTVSTDPRWLAIQSKLKLVRQQKLAIGAFVTIYERYGMALSRELSRKTSSGEHMKPTRYGNH